MTDQPAVPAEPATPALDLDAVEARVPDGYDAPWRVEPSESGEWLVAYATDCPQAGLVATVPDYGWTLAEFIAAARSDVPTLTAEVRRLRAVLDAARCTDPGPAPTTYALPPEPPPEVTELWDADGARWINEDGSWRVDDDDPDMAISWHGALEYGPLSSVPPGTEASQ